MRPLGREKNLGLPFEAKMEVYIDNTPYFRDYTPVGEGKGSE